MLSKSKRILDVCHDSLHVGAIQCSINLIKDKERRRVEAMNGKEQCKSSNGFLSSRKLFHISKAFERRHCVKPDSTLKRHLKRNQNMEEQSRLHLENPNSKRQIHPWGSDHFLSLLCRFHRFRQQHAQMQ